MDKLYFAVYCHDSRVKEIYQSFNTENFNIEIGKVYVLQIELNNQDCIIRSTILYEIPSTFVGHSYDNKVPVNSHVDIIDYNSMFGGKAANPYQYSISDICRSYLSNGKDSYNFIHFLSRNSCSVIFMGHELVQQVYLNDMFYYYDSKISFSLSDNVLYTLNCLLVNFPLAENLIYESEDELTINELVDKKIKINKNCKYVKNNICTINNKSLTGEFSIVKFNNVVFVTNNGNTIFKGFIPKGLFVIVQELIGKKAKLSQKDKFSPSLVVNKTYVIHSIHELRSKTIVELVDEENKIYSTNLKNLKLINDESSK